MTIIKAKEIVLEYLEWKFSSSPYSLHNLLYKRGDGINIGEVYKRGHGVLVNVYVGREQQELFHFSVYNDGNFQIS